MFSMATGHLVGTCLINLILKLSPSPRSCSWPLWSPRPVPSTSAFQAASFTPHSDPRQVGSILYAFYLRGNWGTEKSADLPEVPGLLGMEPQWKQPAWCTVCSWALAGRLQRSLRVCVESGGGPRVPDRRWQWMLPKCHVELLDLKFQVTLFTVI